MKTCRSLRSSKEKLNNFIYLEANTLDECSLIVHKYLLFLDYSGHMANSRIGIERYFRPKVADHSVSLHKRFVKATHNVEAFSISGKGKANNIYKASGESANHYFETLGSLKQ